MEFGIFGGAKVGRANPLGDSYRYQEFIDYVVHSEQIGFRGVFLVEHHFTGVGQLSASLNLLSYLAGRTTKLRLGTAVMVLPWHNPVLLAEQVATLDVLSGGRVDLGVGRGYRKKEFDAFCVPMSEAWDRYNECFSLMMKCWESDERFSYESARWKFKDIVVEPAPIQRPHPPIWIAAGSPESIERVANENRSLLIDQIGSIDQSIERVNLYLDTLAKNGLARDPMRIGVTRALHIVRNEDEKRKSLERRRENLNNIRELARPPIGVKPESYADTDIADTDSALIGTPAEIVEKLNRLAAGGVEYVLLTNAVATRESLDIFAREIMPNIDATKKRAAA